jgi:ATP-dependent exoDNAse (exonuclease V) alpha subunit
MDDPLDQADRSKYVFGRMIRECVGADERCFVGSAVWFPSVEKNNSEGGLPQRYENVTLFYEDKFSPRDAMEKIYDFFGAEYVTNISGESYKKLLDKFCPTFRATASLRLSKDEREAMFVRLTDEQCAILDFLEEQLTAVIQGGAGTGKTMIAVEKARRLAACDKVLFLCFNSLLAAHLAENHSSHNVKFINIHKLVSSETGEQYLKWDDIEKFIENADDKQWPYKHIIVDEGQDFPDEIISALSQKAENANGCCYVFYDKNQLVQQKNFPKWIEEAECRLILKQNCRNTKQIAVTSGKPIAFNPKLPAMAINGDVPKFHIIGEPGDLRAFLEERITKLLMMYDENQICLITLKKEETSLLNGAASIGSHEISRTRNGSGIFFTTARKFKGMESDSVILVDADAASFEDDIKRRLFYVAASRAKHQLDICFTGSDEDLKTLADDIFCDDANPKRTLVERLGVAVKDFMP